MPIARKPMVRCNMIVVIDYKAGNLYSVGNALKFLGYEFQFSGDPEVVRKADRVILPGVGSARSAMQSLEEQKLVPVIRQLQVPFLGICLGLQVLFEQSEEDDTSCLGIVPGAVRQFDRSKMKVPHMGWNQVDWLEDGALPPWREELLKGIPRQEFFYFVHSYYAPVVEKFSLAVTNYETQFSSALVKDNFVGFQFHPERSGKVGLKLLSNFLSLKM